MSASTEHLYETRAEKIERLRREITQRQNEVARLVLGNSSESVELNSVAKEMLADQLETEKREVEKLGFGLWLMTGRPEVEQMVVRINAWIDDACEVLRN